MFSGRDLFTTNVIGDLKAETICAFPSFDGVDTRTWVVLNKFDIVERLGVSMGSSCGIMSHRWAVKWSGSDCNIMQVTICASLNS